MKDNDKPLGAQGIPGSAQWAMNGNNSRKSRLIRVLFKRVVRELGCAEAAQCMNCSRRWSGRSTKLRACGRQTPQGAEQCHENPYTSSRLHP